MVATDFDRTDAILAVNIFLAAFCLGVVLVVVGAVFRDMWERHRRRRMIPDGWPPTRKGRRRGLFA